MKTVHVAAFALFAAVSMVHATEVGVSIAISQPGVYGRIDIGRFPQPAVIVSRPVIIAPQPVVVAPQPVYMWVPKGHRKDWSKHCRHYNACGVPVHFVRHDWYDQDVRHANEGKGKGKGKGKE